MYSDSHYLPHKHQATDITTISQGFFYSVA